MAALNILTVAFYTEDGDGYEKEVKRLTASFERCGIDHAVQKVSEMEWQEAVCWKPEFILTCLEHFESLDGILYVDADAEFMNEPDFGIFKDCHLAFHEFKRGPHHPVEVLTGTLYFANTPLVKEFLEEWATETQKWRNTDTPEQCAWKSIWKGWENRLVSKPLPPEWVWIYDDFPRRYGDRNPDDIVVKHYQASRRLRNRVPKK
tara:strand:+ start:365 stop:979 length:615 start_codon:yes stop_codon:yes gene_type:complete